LPLTKRNIKVDYKEYWEIMTGNKLLGPAVDIAGKVCEHCCERIPDVSRRYCHFDPEMEDQELSDICDYCFDEIEEAWEEVNG